MARAVLIYLFYGVCARRQTKRGWKTSSIIFEIRKQYNYGINTFANVDKHFTKLIKYLKSHPEQVQALHDMTFPASDKLLALVEVMRPKSGVSGVLDV